MNMAKLIKYFGIFFLIRITKKKEKAELETKKLKKERKKRKDIN